MELGPAPAPVPRFGARWGEHPVLWLATHWAREGVAPALYLRAGWAEELPVQHFEAPGEEWVLVRPVEFLLEEPAQGCSNHPRFEGAE